MSQCYENVQKNELINNYSPVKRRKNVAISNQNIVDQEESSSSSPASLIRFHKNVSHVQVLRLMGNDSF